MVSSVSSYKLFVYDDALDNLPGTGFGVAPGVIPGLGGEESTSLPSLDEESWLPTPLIESRVAPGGDSVMPATSRCSFVTGIGMDSASDMLAKFDDRVRF